GRRASSNRSARVRIPPRRRPVRRPIAGSGRAAKATRWPGRRGATTPGRAGAPRARSARTRGPVARRTLPCSPPPLVNATIAFLQHQGDVRLTTTCSLGYRFHTEMADPATLRRLCEILAQVSDAPADTLSASSTPQNTGGWDSFANLNLMAHIEEEYGITFSTGDAIQLKSLGDIADYVDRHA